MHRYLITLVLLLALAACSSTPTQESAGEYLDNSVITSRVKMALIAEPEVKSLPITVKTFKGVVQLSGFVDTHQQKEVAGQTASQIPGVIKVLNYLTVKTQP